MSSLTELDAHVSANGSLDGIECLVSLTHLDLHGQISDLAPLVANTGLDTRDVMNVKNNNLDCMTQADNIAALLDRGVRLDSGC